MARIGAGIEQLADLRATFDRESAEVDRLTRTVGGRVQSTDWEGPAAERFRSAWQGDFEPALRRLQAALQEAAAEVDRRRIALLEAGG